MIKQLLLPFLVMAMPLVTITIKIPKEGVKRVDGYVIEKYDLDPNTMEIRYSFKYSRFTEVGKKISYDVLNGYTFSRLKEECNLDLDSAKFYVDSLPPIDSTTTYFRSYIFKSMNDKNVLYVAYRISGEAVIIKDGCEKFIKRKINKHETCPESIKYPLISFNNPITKKQLTEKEITKFSFLRAGLNTFSIIVCE